MKRLLLLLSMLLTLGAFSEESKAWAQDYYTQAYASREVVYARVMDVKPIRQRSDGLALYAVRLLVEESLRSAGMGNDVVNLYLVCPTPADFPSELSVEAVEAGATAMVLEASLRPPTVGSRYVFFARDFDGESLVLAQHSTAFMLELSADQLSSVRYALSVYFPYY